MSNRTPAEQRAAQAIDYRERHDVQRVHAAIQREKREPAVGREPLSLWLISFYAIALFVGAFYIGRYSGSFSGDSLDPGQQLTGKFTVAAPSAESAPVSSRPATVQVLIQNMQFSPATLEIKKGDVVEWKNDDLTPHTATSTSFDSGSIEPEKSWRHAFTGAGSFPYACTFHPDMKASVVVKER